MSSLCSHNHILFVASFSARPRALRRDRTCFGHRGNCSSVHAKRHEQKRGVLSGIPPLSADAVSSLEPVGSTVSLPPTPNHVIILTVFHVLTDMCLRAGLLPAGIWGGREPEVDSCLLCSTHGSRASSLISSLLSGL